MTVLETLTKRILPKRGGVPKAIVIHGSGEVDLDKCLDWYTCDHGLQPHYFISTTGTIRRIVPDDHVAYHAGLTEAEVRLYRLGFQHWSQWVWDHKKDAPFNQGAPFSGYRYWRDEWVPRGISSPLGLVTGVRPNLESIGIEMQSLAEPHKYYFSDAQYEALADVCTDLWRRHGIPMDRRFVLQHADVSPMRRCNAAGPWDPPAGFSIMRLWDLLKHGRLNA